MIETWYRGGDWVNQWLSIRHLFGILHQIGLLEDAAVVHGGLATAGAVSAMPFEPATPPSSTPASRRCAASSATSDSPPLGAGRGDG